ncbi:hypothetical protein CASFOL_038759 [Castilleja foliolosa]|uniref:Uncharacterized protein n=1 Tax=Castilleja foliolosa TaxID=1961234 RepID=A0ABD3BIR5_9LAMI
MVDYGIFKSGFPDSANFPFLETLNLRSIMNVEAEKQLNFFQGCVDAAFAELDNAILETEKAKEKVELMPQELNKSQRRVEELTNDLLEEKELTKSIRIDLEKHEKQNEAFKEVIDKFYHIRQCSLS